MTTTLTFRLESEQRKKLRNKARLLGKSESAILRELLDRELEERPMSAAIGHLKGTLSLEVKKPDSLRQTLRERNWRS
jgi:Ribbon-helix-helix protein, copG family